MLKYCAVFSLWAVVGLGANFQTYQAARLVIGQSTFTGQDYGPSDTRMGSAAGIAFAGNTLFVADGNRMGLTPVYNRILIFGNITQSMPAPLDPIGIYTGRCPVCLGQATAVLGQPDYTSVDYHISQTGLRTPSGVASDGRVLAVADTQNNRVLVWNSIPTTNGQPADILLGQPDFNTVTASVPVTSSTFRAPQGVWIQNGKLYVADTQNNRVMIWNSIPSKNNQPADLVLGQPNFTTAPQLDLTQSNLTAAANTLLNPTSVSSDGTHLFVADLGFNRVLIWNTIPTQNQQPADVEVGQPDMVSSVVNNAFTADATTGVQTPVLCTVATGTDSNNNPTYPAMCEKTLNFPRFALSDGKRLYIADGGNDRVLVFNTIPTQNAAGADAVLGQPDAISDILSSNSNASTSNTTTPNLFQSGSNILPSPTSLAWDGTNLYVADPTDYRVLVFTPADADIPANGIRNAASFEIFATDRIILQGSITANDTLTAIVCPPVNGTAVTACSSTTGASYTYTVQASDTFDTVLQGLSAVVNAGSGDPYVIAKPGLGFQFISFVARVSGPDGNQIGISSSTSTTATITITVANPTLVGGADPTTLAPGSLISILGTNLADGEATADTNAPALPFELGGVQAYVDGIRLPLVYVSSTQINAQMPFEVIDANSSSLYVRIQHVDGSVSITNAIGIPVDTQVPGIFAQAGQDPRVAIAFHGSNYASTIVSVDGGIQAGDAGTVTIGSSSYTYTVQTADTLATIRDAFIALINANPEESVIASATPAFTRINLRAKVPGPEGEGVPVTATAVASSTATAGTTVALVLTATNSVTCCASREGALITPTNPARGGETIYVLATGLGIVMPDEARLAIVDGAAYTGPAVNTATSTVSAQAGGVTPNVISAGLMVGAIGIYKVVMQLGPSTPTDPNSQVTIAQDIYLSNVVTIPVYNATPPVVNACQ